MLVIVGGTAAHTQKVKNKSELAQWQTGKKKKRHFYKCINLQAQQQQLNIKQQMSQPHYDLAADVCLLMRRRPTGFDLSRPLSKLFYFYIWSVVTPERKHL